MFFRDIELDANEYRVSIGGDPARAYDRRMQRMLLFQRIEEVLKPRELTLVRHYHGIGLPNEKGMTFQKLAVQLNYNGPSGAEKAYKAAIRKLKKELHSGAYGQWLSIQEAINRARAEAATDSLGITQRHRPHGWMKRIWRSSLSARSLCWPVYKRYSVRHWRMKKNSSTVPGVSLIPYCYSLILNLPFRT